MREESALAWLVPGDEGGQGTWTNITSAGTPPSWGEPAMTYVPDLGGILLFSTETWVYDSNEHRWRRLSPAVSPPETYGGSLAYDSAVRKAILFGGFRERPDHCLETTNTTWLYDPMANTWTNVTPVHSPPVRWYTSMAYDPGSQKVVLFGGHEVECRFRIPEVTGPRLNDTWIYDSRANLWTNVTSWLAPPARSHAGLAIDTRASRMVLFGGVSGDPWDHSRRTFGDTWIFNPRTGSWWHYDPPERPAGRYRQGMASVLSTTILYGGCSATSCYRDTWTYDMLTRQWTEVSTNPGPPFAPGTGFASDPSGVIVAYGNSETWEFRSPAPPILMANASAAVFADTTPYTIAFDIQVTGGVSPYAYLWNFGDGTTSTITNPIHTYAAPGRYVVTVRVRDATDHEIIDSLEVSIQPRATPTDGWVPYAIAAASVAIVSGLTLWFWARRRPRPPRQ